jgi:anthraniloyl-CoA monooxygenase
LGEIFSTLLDGNELCGGRADQPQAQWLRFDHVVNTNWSVGNVVLMGDAAHTTHYSIGSGTKLALEDAIALDGALQSCEDIPAALRNYQAQRAGPVGERQRAARLSQTWFEQVPEILTTAPDALSFAYQLRTRRDPTAARSQIGWLLHRATQYSAGLRARQAISEAKQAVRRRRAGITNKLN